MSYRCDACGNKTRFDVYESKRVRAFHHYTLAGELTIEEEEVLAGDIDRVVCRWCGSSLEIGEVAADGPREQPAGGETTRNA